MKTWITAYFTKPSGFQNMLALWLSVLLWLVLALVIGILVVHNPSGSSVIVWYHYASVHWWSRGDLYEVRETMNYLPHFAIVFSLFDAMPVPAGDLLWRYCSMAVVATAIWRFTRRIFDYAAPRHFFWATFLAFPLAGAAARNGQSNLMLAGFMLHAAACLSAGEWWLAACMIAFSIVAKPVAIVLMLLALVFYSPLRLPMAVSLGVMAVFPFLFAPPEYVLGEYRAFFGNLRDCAGIADYGYADITGILWALHVHLPVIFLLVVRVLAGFPALALGWLGTRRLDEPLRAFWLLTIATCYLMLFNPKNESNSYAIFAPVSAIWAVYFMGNAPQWMGWIIACMVFSMGVLPNIVRPLFGNAFALFYHPAMTILFLALLTAWLWREKTSLQSLPGENAGKIEPPLDSKRPAVLT